MDEEGKDINPHIPQYISDAPWYTEPKGPTLKHQRPQEERQIKYSGIDDWYRKGVNREKVATRYRKGACENCGAMTHKKRDCLERPRRVNTGWDGGRMVEDLGWFDIPLGCCTTCPVLLGQLEAWGDMLRSWAG